VFLTEAVKALTLFDSTEAVPRMRELLALDPADNRNAGLFYALFRAMMAFSVRDAAPRIAEIGLSSEMYRSLAIEALGSLGDPAALPALRKMLGAIGGKPTASASPSPWPVSERPAPRRKS